MIAELLPAINASLNGLSAVLLAAGYAHIRAGRREAHKRCMIAACVASALFLVCYVAYHSFHGATRYQGQGALRPIYFSILVSHTILAVANVPLVAMTLARALRGELARHKRLARWTLPIWFYVSVTGVAIYVLLYRL